MITTVFLLLKIVLPIVLLLIMSLSLRAQTASQVLTVTTSVPNFGWRTPYWVKNVGYGVSKTGNDTSMTLSADTTVLTTQLRSANYLRTALVTGSFLIGILGYTPADAADLSNYYTKTQADIRYLQSEVDGSVSNELQTISRSGSTLSISSGNSLLLPKPDYDSILNLPSSFPNANINYTSYQALVSQSGTAAPTASRKDANFGATTFTWARTGAGTYTVTASSAVFTSSKTVVISSVETAGLQKYTAVITSTTVITISSTVQSVISLILSLTNTDSLLSNTLIEIRVYN